MKNPIPKRMHKLHPATTYGPGKDGIVISFFQTFARRREMLLNATNPQRFNQDGCQDGSLSPSFLTYSEQRIRSHEKDIICTKKKKKKKKLLKQRSPSILRQPHNLNAPFGKNIYFNCSLYYLVKVSQEITDLFCSFFDFLFGKSLSIFPSFLISLRNILNFMDLLST